MSGDGGQISEPGNKQNLGNSAPQNNEKSPIRYQIQVQGLVSDKWFDNFTGLSFHIFEKNLTLISAILTDKSALHGLLTRLGELNLTILSVNKIEETERPKET